MSYKVNYTAKARKDLKNLPPDIAQRIILSINGIREDPYAHVKKIKETKRTATLHPLCLRIPGDRGYNRESPADQGYGNRAQR